MSAWDGWTADIIAGLGIPSTGNVTNFLVDWEITDNSPCKFNPLVASHTERGSTACKDLGGGKVAQAYTTHARAIAGTRAQLNSGTYPHLHDALHSGDPLGYKPLDAVVADLRKWGASGWAAQIVKNFNLGGGTPAPVGPAHVTTAWNRWMRALGHTGPTSHNRIAKSTARVRRLSR